MSIELFLNDMSKVGVAMTESDGTYLFAGLPVMRTGTWNGREYTDDDLRAMASNFEVALEADSWQPPMLPKHSVDKTGRPADIDASDILGWHEALKFDEDKHMLLADVRVPAKSDADKIASGKLRYISSEIVRSGYSDSTGRVYETPVYVGAAFVGNPAVKGMPWEIVTNSMEFEDERVPKPSWMEQFLGWLGMRGIPEDDVFEVMEKLDAGEPVITEEDTMEQSEAVEQETASVVVDETVETETAEDTVEANEEVIETSEEVTVDPEIEALRAENVRLQTEARRRESEGTIERWIAGGHLMPALRDQAFRLVDALSDSEPIVETNEAGENVEIGLLELLSSVIEGGESKIKTAPQAIAFNGSYVAPERLSKEEAEQVAERMVKSLNR